jgi:Ca2+-binding EF-hand superfamily protein
MNDLDLNPPEGYEPYVKPDNNSEELSRLFDMLDEDKDHKLSKEEMKKLL